MHPVERLLRPLGRALRDRRADPALSIAECPALAAPARLRLTSPAFDDGDEIPARHCGWLIGEEVSPALDWSTPPDGTADLPVVLEDLDAPRRAPAIHTIAALASDSRRLPEGDLAAGTPGVCFVGSRVRRRYFGPRPIPDHGPHRYRFHLYALDVVIDPASTRGVDALLDAVSGHVLASGMLGGVREA